MDTSPLSFGSKNVKNSLKQFNEFFFFVPRVGLEPTTLGSSACPDRSIEDQCSSQSRRSDLLLCKSIGGRLPDPYGGVGAELPICAEGGTRTHDPWFFRPML